MVGSSVLVPISRELTRRLATLRFATPVTHVYRPLEYARAPYEAYLERYGAKPREVVMIGMNPGPFGMAQTGVPFGDVASVRDWLGITGRVEAPAGAHEKRPVLGFDCPRSEVSGTRLWGWARDRFGTPERFFSRFFVANYCPLVFMEASGANRTPDKLPASERAPLLAACDDALRESVGALGARRVVGIGAFAAQRARSAFAGTDVVVTAIPHPSPASPAANRGWSAAAEAALRAGGIAL